MGGRGEGGWKERKWGSRRNKGRAEGEGYVCCAGMLELLGKERGLY